VKSAAVKSATVKPAAVKPATVKSATAAAMSTPAAVRLGACDADSANGQYQRRRYGQCFISHENLLCIRMMVRLRRAVLVRTTGS
jgi:hypothetical protein